MASHPKIMTISLQEGLFDDTVDMDIIRRLLHANVLRDVQDLTLQGFQVEELSMDLGDRDPMSPLSTLHLNSLSLIQCDVLPLLALFPSVRRLNVHRCTYSTAVGALKLRHLKETHLSTPLEDLHQILIPSSYVLNLSSLSRTRRSPLDAKLPLDSNMRISHAAVLHLSVDSADSASVLGSIMEIISRRCSRVRYLILRFTSKEAAMRCAVVIHLGTESISLTLGTSVQEIATLSSLSSAHLLCVRVEASFIGERQPHLPETKPTWTNVLTCIQDALTGAIPSLRFYSQNLERRAVSYSNKTRRCTRSHEERCWQVQRHTEGSATPNLELIPGAIGESIHNYLQSPEFCKALRFDGARSYSSSRAQCR